MAGSEFAPIGSPSSFGNQIFSTTVIAATTNGGKIPVDRYTSAFFTVISTAVTGTTPTFDVKIQTLLGDGSTWTDIAAFTQITSATTRWMYFPPGAAKESAVSAGALAAGTMQGALGNFIRVRIVVAGTNPSGSFTVYGSFLE
jgi:hypothetical protein